MNKIEKIQPSHIFTNYIYKSIPLAFDESMSYYETLCGVLDLLHTHTEVINNNAELLAQLESYVEHYFENLDVQEEINNKLDEMAEDGTLENLIGQYIELATTYVYNNVAEMKEATNLVNGNFARTSGFYEYNDEGGAYYKVRTITTDDTIDEKTIIALSDNTLIAELLQQNEMNFKQYGAKGDGETDDTEAIQSCFDNSKNIVIKDGVYMVDASIGVLPSSNSNIKLVNATIKAIPNNLTNYQILYLNGVSNVIIEGGIIAGEREDHEGVTGEWGHCLAINNSSNIIIKNIILKDAWGDGLYLKDGTNIKTENIVCDNNRRQGISVIKVNGYRSLNDKLINTNGTNPQSGIDIEPNTATDYIKDVVIDNLYTENNVGAGVDLQLNSLNGTSGLCSIKINNHHDKGSATGLKVSKDKTLNFNIDIINPLEEDNQTGISLRDCFDNGVNKVNIIKPVILNCNINQVNTSYICGISTYTTISTSDNLGGYNIVNPYITSKETTENRNAMFFGDSTNNNPVKNINIIDPLNHQSNLKINFSYEDNIKITDKYELYRYETNSSTNAITSWYYSTYSNINFTSGRNITLSEYLAIGTEIIFVKEKPSYNINIVLPATEKIQRYNASAGATISLTNMNAKTHIKKISSTDWIVLDEVAMQ